MKSLKKHKMDKKRKHDLTLKGISWALSLYLFLNLTLYVLGKVSHFVFWGTLILIWILTKKVIPLLRTRIDCMK